MKIAVINGSPSGLAGVTACSVKYLQQRFPMHEFVTFEVAKKVRALEKSAAQRDVVVAALANADLVLWAFPVYVMLVPAQLKRFIELLMTHPGREALRGKAAACLSTSAHHYDHTAHEYVRGICADLGLRCLGSFSAGLEDLLHQTQREALVAFGTEVFGRTERGDTVVDYTPPPIPARQSEQALPACEPRQKRPGRKVVIVSDAAAGDLRLRSMIAGFSNQLGVEVDVLELGRLKVAGGCLGCMHCSAGDGCVYPDDYAEAFDERVRAADVVMYAGTTVDRAFSARMKTFIDRHFSYGHRPILAGKLMGFLVSGPLGHLQVLREVLEAHIEVSHCQRLGVVSDEGRDEEVMVRLGAMARAADRWLEAPWRAPATFRGVGADKNFRDLVYSHRGFMTADHRYYAANGLYDFPQRDWRRWVLNTALLCLRAVPFIRRLFDRQLRHARLIPFQKVLNHV